MIELKMSYIASAIKQQKLPRFDVVVGVAKGGIIPAALIAGKLSCELKFVRISLRDEKNSMRFSHPRILKKCTLPFNSHKVLIVDDVSRSGKTLEAAKKMFKNYRVKTLTLIGKADYVLFPRIKSCVRWPWEGCLK